MPTTASPKNGSKRIWRNASHDERRNLIVHAAMRLLDRHGRRGVTMRRVAKSLSIGTMTLYTYFNNQHLLLREVCRRGFELLHESCDCENQDQQTSAESWKRGSRGYVRFAMEHPNLYELMFSAPVSEGGTDTELLRGGFENLLSEVRQRLADKGLSDEALEAEALRRAGRYWIGLHGLASLAIAGRLDVLGGDIERLLADILIGVAPD